MFSCLSPLRELYLGENFLGGTIPLDFFSGIQNKTAPLRVDLVNNYVRGSIRTSIVQLSDLRLLLSGNFIDEVPQEICDSRSWVNGLLASGCDFLLCGSFVQSFEWEDLGFSESLSRDDHLRQ